ncbi:unnamed protein product [Echinostoma caproni]|uniref:Transmembrane protein n=1 Tax=Echinostoma caproni TaxID=27848 RepID=A0A183BDU3_9TREM|nr:unnamed protein product [Echinostoma caproni]
MHQMFYTYSLPFASLVLWNGFVYRQNTLYVLRSVPLWVNCACNSRVNSHELLFSCPNSQRTNDDDWNSMVDVLPFQSVRGGKLFRAMHLSVKNRCVFVCVGGCACLHVLYHVVGRWPHMALVFQAYQMLLPVQSV